MNGLYMTWLNCIVANKGLSTVFSGNKNYRGRLIADIGNDLYILKDANTRKPVCQFKVDDVALIENRRITLKDQAIVQI